MEMEIDFMADGLRLRGTLHLPSALRPPLVIGCHGLLSDRTSSKQIALAEACRGLGLAFFRFDHRGCGQSEGRLENDTTLENRCSDLGAAIRHLANRTDLGERIGLFGSSMGGAVCLRAGGRADIAAIVTLAAPVRSRTAGRHPVPDPEMEKMASVLKEEFDLGPHLGGLRNILVYHGEADEVVPVADAHEIFSRAVQPKRLVIQPDGDHRLSEPRHLADFVGEASAWLANRLT